MRVTPLALLSGPLYYPNSDGDFPVLLCPVNSSVDHTRGMAARFQHARVSDQELDAAGLGVDDVNIFGGGA